MDTTLRPNLPPSGQVWVLGPDTLQLRLSMYTIGCVQSVGSLFLHMCPKNLFWVWVWAWAGSGVCQG